MEALLVTPLLRLCMHSLSASSCAAAIQVVLQIGTLMAEDWADRLVRPTLKPFKCYYPRYFETTSAVYLTRRSSCDCRQNAKRCFSHEGNELQAYSMLLLRTTC